MFMHNDAVQEAMLRVCTEDDSQHLPHQILAYVKSAEL